MKPDPKKLVVYYPDTRGVTVSRYGFGNMKIGPDVFTYSRYPGLPSEPALGFEGHYLMDRESWLRSDYVTHPGYEGTCPGASDECRSICYAARPVAEDGAVNQMWWLNSRTDDVPPIPDECKLLRLHVGGDFNTVAYIENWIARLTERPDVTMWAYTRSWRVPELLPALERLRALPNVQLFASMDQSIPELPPVGWRRAWIDGDARLTPLPAAVANREMKSLYIHRVVDGVSSFVCPEETGAKPNCEACRYCIEGLKNDVTFLRH